LEQALGEWRELSEASRPKRERELARIEARIRKAANALDRYFLAFEEGKLREEICTTRIEELSKELACLEAQRTDLIEEISESRPQLPGPDELSKLRKEVQRSLENGGLSQRKAAMQAILAEIKVRDRTHIKPVFRVPIFRPPYGLVSAAGVEHATSVV
jgi:chromosome segregation ATPase